MAGKQLVDDGMVLVLGAAGVLAAAGLVRQRGSFAAVPIYCPEGTTPVSRRGYVRRDGTRVAATRYCQDTSGQARGRTTPGAKYGRGRGYTPWITREGKLGGKGFLSRPFSEQKAILDRCVPEWGYRSCLGSIMVLERSGAMRAKYGDVLKKLRRYLVDTYGGAGASERWPRRKKRRAA